MRTQTAEMPVAATGRPLLTVIRPDAPPPFPRIGFVEALDQLGQAVGVYGLTGGPLHLTKAFRAVLDQRGVSAFVRTAVAAIAAEAEVGRRGHVVPPPVAYRDRDCVVRASLYRPSETTMVLVCIEAARGPQQLSDEEIVASYKLTPMEVRVARLLATGEPNDVIARTLGVSRHTARHHTEHVHRKLGISRRSAVAGRLLHKTAL